MTPQQEAQLRDGMAKLLSLDEVKVKNLGNVSVEFKGDKIYLPEGMTILQAIETLLAFEMAQEKTVEFSEVFKVFPWDGAHAMSEVLKTMFGWTEAKDRPGLFGDTPPKFIQTEVAPNVYKSIAWGDFGLPGLPITLQTQYARVEGRWCFQVIGKAKRKAEPIVHKIFAAVREYLRKGGSIYQGKAIKLNLDEKEGLPTPSFMPLDKVDESAMLFSRTITELLETNVFTPIRRVKDLERSGIPFKRGTLFAGTYGTGKTMAAGVAAKYAVASNVTFIYIKEAAQLAAAIDFAKMYANPGAVVFCEDIDREAGGERNQKMDELLNIIDGIDTKFGQVMVVLTTNNLQSIHPAMLREGRLDAVIEFLPPDAETSEKIIRRYCGSTLAETENLNEVGKLCAGQIPATLAEVVKRAKLYQLSLQEAGTEVRSITGEALRLAAMTMMGQMAIRERRIKEEEAKGKKVSMDDLVRDNVAAAMKDGGGKAVVDAIRAAG